MRLLKKTLIILLILTITASATAYGECIDYDEIIINPIHNIFESYNCSINENNMISNIGVDDKYVIYDLNISQSDYHIECFIELETNPNEAINLRLLSKLESNNYIGIDFINDCVNVVQDEMVINTTSNIIKNNTINKISITIQNNNYETNIIFNINDLRIYQYVIKDVMLHKYLMIKATNNYSNFIIHSEFYDDNQEQQEDDIAGEDDTIDEDDTAGEDDTINEDNIDDNNNSDSNDTETSLETENDKINIIDNIKIMLNDICDVINKISKSLIKKSKEPLPKDKPIESTIEDNNNQFLISTPKYFIEDIKENSIIYKTINCIIITKYIIIIISIIIPVLIFIIIWIIHRAKTIDY